MEVHEPTQIFPPLIQLFPEQKAGDICDTPSHGIASHYKCIILDDVKIWKLNYADSKKRDDCIDERLRVRFIVYIAMYLKDFIGIAYFGWNYKAASITVPQN